MTEPVRAVVVDDSPTARAVIVGILEADGVEVVGQAADGAAGVAMVRDLRPSVVVMDIVMPGLNGFEATRAIMAECPTPIVILTGSFWPGDVAVSLQATKVGALTVQPKPPGPSSPNFAEEADRLAVLIRAMADVKVVGRRGGQSRPSSSRARSPRLEAGTIEVVGVGASTGGPAAVHRLLGLLPPTLGAPVVLVQHIPDGFAEGLVRWLATGSSLAVTIARSGETALPGHVYVAPPGHQMEVVGNCVLRLHDGPPVGGFRPSVSTLFSSLASSFGRAAAAVVLTGMGADGLEGTRALRAAGGIVMAQDEASSVVFGMPRVIARAGLADVVGSVDVLALELARLAGSSGHGRGRR